MPIINIHKANFESTLEENEIVFIDFWAEWCAPCKQFSIVFEKIAVEFPSLCFAKVNIEEEPELAEMFFVQSIPHLLVFKQGILIYSEAGSMPGSTLKELVGQAIDADVSDIRKEIE